MQTPRASATMEPTEQEPLLGYIDDASSPKPLLSAHQRLLLFLVGVSIVAADFGNSLTLAPQIAIFESLICRRLGGSGDCKSPEVQGELALLIGWKDTIDQLPGTILALPYGLVADRIGRKPVRGTHSGGGVSAGSATEWAWERSALPGGWSFVRKWLLLTIS